MQCNLRRRNRTAAHDLRIDARNSPIHDTSQRTQTSFLRLLKRHHDHGRCAIDNTAGVAGGDGAVFAERRAQLGQAFHGGLRTPVIIFGQLLASRLALRIPQRHRSQLFLNASFFVGGIGAVLRAEREFVLRLAGNSLLLGVTLGGSRHLHAAIGIEQRDHERVFEFAARQQA